MLKPIVTVLLSVATDMKQKQLKKLIIGILQSSISQTVDK